MRDLRWLGGLSDRGAQLKIVAVGIGKVERSRVHPFELYRTFGCDPLRSQNRSRSLQLGFVNGEGEVLRDPGVRGFLQDPHARSVSYPEEQPLALLVTESGGETEHVAIESFGPGKLSDSDSNFEYAANRKHVTPSSG